jgi:hypothetical protein
METATATNGNGSVTVTDENVLAALDLGFRTLPGMKSKLGLPADFDLRDRLRDMEIDSKLRRECEAKGIELPKGLPSKTFTVHKEGVVAKYLNLNRGGQILVAFEGDLFTMTAGEMELLGRLNQVLQSYEEA